MVDRVLRDAGVRWLFIKGPVLTAQGLRKPQRSIDVDVLIHPDDQQKALEQLATHGWSTAFAITSPHTLPPHSAAVRHEGWPLEIDVHDRFPGFLADARTVFEALWAHRATANIAGREVPCLQPVAHSLVAALHWLRDPTLVANERNLAYLVEVLGPRLDRVERQAMSDLVSATCSGPTLRPFLEALGVEVPSAPCDDSAWRIQTASTGVRSVSYLVGLRRSSLREIPSQLIHALVLTEAEIRHIQPKAAPGWWGLFLARLRRIRWGLHDLPKAMQIVWRESRRK